MVLFVVLRGISYLQRVPTLWTHTHHLSQAKSRHSVKCNLCESQSHVLSGEQNAVNTWREFLCVLFGPSFVTSPGMRAWNPTPVKRANEQAAENSRRDWRRNVFSYDACRLENWMRTTKVTQALATPESVSKSNIHRSVSHRSLLSSCTAPAWSPFRLNETTADKVMSPTATTIAAGRVGIFYSSFSFSFRKCLEAAAFSL